MMWKRNPNRHAVEHPRKKKKAEAEPPTEPTKPDSSKTRTVSKASTVRSVIDVEEKRMAAKVSAEGAAPPPKTKASEEPLKAKSKEDREAIKLQKKQTKLSIIEKRGELAKAKLEKNTESVSNLMKEIKDLKIALL